MMVQPTAPHPPAAGASGPSARTARDFEGVFAGQMVQIMLENAQIEGEFSGGHAEAMFTGVLAEKIGGEIARAGSFGIAPRVMEQIARMRGEA